MQTKRIISGMLTAAIVFSIMTGCGQSKKVESKATTAPTSATPVAAKSSKASDKPLNLTIHLHYGDSRVFKDDFPIYKKAAEITNITLKGTASQVATDSNQVFSIMMASGELPDIIYGKKDEQINKYAVQGAFQPLDELIEKYAPNIKEYLKKYPEMKKQTVAADGKMYMLPFMYEGEAAEGFFVRQDWLDKLKLSVPKTVNEFHDVLKAFIDKDANGNGKKDEVPYFCRNMQVDNIASLWGIKGGYKGFYAGADGKVVNAKYSPEYKIAMTSLAKWMSEGLIDKEIYTRGQKSRDILLGDNVGGATHDWFVSTGSYNTILKDKIPGFNLIAIAPPADLNGKQFDSTSRSLVNAVGWGMSKNNKSPIETIKYFDFWYSEQGRILNQYGIEGEQYTMVNGKPVYKDEFVNGKEPVAAAIEKLGGLQIGTQSIIASEEQIANPVAKAGMKLYNDNKYPTAAFPQIPLTADEQKLVSTKWPALETYMKEVQQKWVLGAEPVEAGWDKYISTLKSMGIEDMIKVYNDAYQRYMK